MSASVQPTHPVVACADALIAALVQVSDAQPTFMTTDAKRHALLRLARAKAALAELEARVLAAADDVAEQSGARDAGAWLAHATRSEPRQAHADLALARALDRRPALAQAMRDGAVNTAQARVIVEAVADLPDRLGARVHDDAERSLVGFAREHGPRELRRLGRHILDVVAPEIADAEDAARLEALEETARQKASVRSRPIGGGLVRTTVVHRDVEAARLLTYLDAYTNPRRPGHDDAADSTPGLSDWERVPLHRRRAWALTALLDHLDPAAIPASGGVATQVVVTTTLDALRADLATAALAAHGETLEISAADARRLACEAQIVPAVLGGQSQILDAGRSRRLFSGVQRTLIQQRWVTCIAEGCTVPAAWSEIHHINGAWAAGGATDLDDGVPACSHHHHLFHAPHRYGWERLPDGRVRFHRRV